MGSGVSITILFVCLILNIHLYFWTLTSSFAKMYNVGKASEKQVPSYKLMHWKSSNAGSMVRWCYGWALTRRVQRPQPSTPVTLKLKRQRCLVQDAQNAQEPQKHKQSKQCLSNPWHLSASPIRSQPPKELKKKLKDKDSINMQKHDIEQRTRAKTTCLEVRFV